MGYFRLCQFTDQGLDSRDLLPSPSIEQRRYRTGGPTRAIWRLTKSCEHSICQCGNDAPRHNRANVQKVEGRARGYASSPRIRFDCGPRRLLLDVAVCQHPERAGLRRGPTKLQTLVPVAQYADPSINLLRQRLLWWSRFAILRNSSFESSAGKACG